MNDFDVKSMKFLPMPYKRADQRDGVFAAVNMPRGREACSLKPDRSKCHVDNQSHCQRRLATWPRGTIWRVIQELAQRKSEYGIVIFCMIAESQPNLDTFCLL